ncbi:MAG: hypothetical protein QXH80_03710, partial [Candidatus Nanoarchaeia archaeon]
DKVANIQHKLDASSPPGSNDGEYYGFSVGSVWVDTKNCEIYICAKATPGEAVWKKLTEDASKLNGKEGSYYLDRANHTGTQPITTIEGLQPALNAKLSGNPPITPGTHTKITYDSKGLITGGENLQVNDIPELPISKTNGLQAALDSKEPAFNKNTAFNKDFGNTAGTVCEGNDPRLSDSRKCNNTFDDPAVARINLGISELAIVKNKLDATTPPTNFDDITENFSIGSKWIDIVNKKIYICVDNKKYSAVWQLISAYLQPDQPTTGGQYKNYPNAPGF